MLEILKDTDKAVLAIRVSGKLTADDYDKILIPKLEEMCAIFDKVKMLVEFGDDFSGWEMSAALDDMKVGLQHYSDFEKFAMVGAPDWVVWGAKMFGVFVSAPIKSFAADERADALEWLAQSTT